MRISRLASRKCTEPSAKTARAARRDRVVLAAQPRHIQEQVGPLEDDVGRRQAPVLQLFEPQLAGGVSRSGFWSRSDDAGVRENEAVTSEYLPDRVGPRYDQK